MACAIPGVSPLTASTGDLFIGDVGQNIEEEIDFQPASDAGGNNYGWHILEGNRCYSPASNCTPPSHYVGSGRRL